MPQPARLRRVVRLVQRALPYREMAAARYAGPPKYVGTHRRPSCRHCQPPLCPPAPLCQGAHEQPGHVFEKGGMPTRGIRALDVDEADLKRLTHQDILQLFKAADALVRTEERGNAPPRRKNTEGRTEPCPKVASSPRNRLALVPRRGSPFNATRCFNRAKYRRIVDQRGHGRRWLTRSTSTQQRY